MGKKDWKANIVRVPPKRCAYPKEISENTCTYTKANF
jgi:hypothetical protein